MVPSMYLLPESTRNTSEKSALLLIPAFGDDFCIVRRQLSARSQLDEWTNYTLSHQTERLSNRL